MNRRSVIFAILVIFISTLAGVSSPKKASACTTMSGSYASNATPFSSPTFSFLAGDVITATNTATSPAITGTGADINLNGTFTVASGGSSISNSVTASVNGIGYVFFYNVNAPGATMNWTISIGCASASGLVTFTNFTDGRMNNHDAAETAAVYCENGGVTIYVVIASQGFLAFKVTKAELANIPLKPARHTLIKSGRGVSLYRLTSGFFQISGPDNYVFLWESCPA